MLTLADIELLFARHGGAAVQRRAGHAARARAADRAPGRAERGERRARHRRLLHDLGHLLNDQGETPTLRGIDDTHQYAALPFLRGLFPRRGARRDQAARRRQALPLRADAGYYDALSDDSKRSLALQGGVFDAGAGRRLHRASPARATR